MSRCELGSMRSDCGPGRHELRRARSCRPSGARRPRRSRSRSPWRSRTGLPSASGRRRPGRSSPRYGTAAAARPSAPVEPAAGTAPAFALLPAAARAGCRLRRRRGDCADGHAPRPRAMTTTAARTVGPTGRPVRRGDRWRRESTRKPFQFKQTRARTGQRTTRMPVTTRTSPVFSTVPTSTR